jgi:hypothetical protein
MTDTEEMYNYLKKNCFHEVAMKTLGGKEYNKRRKTIFWDAGIKKNCKIRNDYF